MPYIAECLLVGAVVGTAIGTFGGLVYFIVFA